jgi:hypothetical protein
LIFPLHLTGAVILLTACEHCQYGPAEKTSLTPLYFLILPNPRVKLLRRKKVRQAELEQVQFTISE